jgi:hypothetical protein
MNEKRGKSQKRRVYQIFGKRSAITLNVPSTKQKKLILGDGQFFSVCHYYGG